MLHLSEPQNAVEEALHKSKPNTTQAPESSLQDAPSRSFMAPQARTSPQRNILPPSECRAAAETIHVQKLVEVGFGARTCSTLFTQNTKPVTPPIWFSKPTSRTATALFIYAPHAVPNQCNSAPLDVGVVLD